MKFVFNEIIVVFIPRKAQHNLKINLGNLCITFVTLSLRTYPEEKGPPLMIFITNWLLMKLKLVVI